MKYGQLAGSKSINSFIYCCFEYICEKDERKFVKKFKKQPHNSDQIMHTFRELILGAFLSSKSFNVRHDCSIEGKTPDWCILSNKSSVIGIVELVNFHLDKRTETDVKHQSEVKRLTLYWRDEKKNNVERLYHCIEDKAVQYKSLAKQLCIPYIVSIFCDISTLVDFEEVKSCLFKKEIGLFRIYHEMSGTLFFYERSERYFFNYANNPNAIKNIDIIDGVFPPEDPQFIA